MDILVGSAILTYLFTGVYFTSPAIGKPNKFIKKHFITACVYPLHTALWFFAEAVALKSDEL